jgi:ABC-type dipeptide/oligopeptide/nickel transport system ATPase component
MIKLIVGRPGAGKSLYAVENILLEKKYKYVITNFLVYPYYVDLGFVKISNIDRIKKIFLWNEEINVLVDFLKQLNKKDSNIRENEILIVIDEAIFFINKRYSQKKSIIDFLTRHRKYKTEIWLITQSKKSLLPEVRDFIDGYIIIRQFREAFFLNVPFLRLLYHKNAMDDLFTINLWVIKPVFFQFYNSYYEEIDKSKGIISVYEYLKRYDEKWKKIIERYEARDTHQGGSRAVEVGGYPPTS